MFWSVPAHSENAVVVRVIDGDTITVQIAGAIRTIRLIGVDTPETVHPTKKVQPGGPEASAFTQAALDRKTVRLEADPAGDDSDRYDRLLRYVYLDGKNFNARLIREGYASDSGVPLLPETRVSTAGGPGAEGAPRDMGRLGKGKSYGDYSACFHLMCSSSNGRT